MFIALNLLSCGDKNQVMKMLLNKEDMLFALMNVILKSKVSYKILLETLSVIEKFLEWD